jgi:hypothetical protein
MEFSDTYQINYCLIKKYPCNSSPGIRITMSNLAFNTQYMVTTELKLRNMWCSFLGNNNLSSTFRIQQIINFVYCVRFRAKATT